MSKRIKLNELNKTRFYMLPKELLLNPVYGNVLSSNAKLVYAILNDRLELSRKNNWVNENNEVYLKFKREKLAKLMSISNKTLIKAINELKKVNLIDEERIGLNKVNHIYVCHMQSTTDDEMKKMEEEYQENLENIEEYSQEDKTKAETVGAELICNNSTSRIETTPHQEVEQLHINKEVSKLAVSKDIRQDFSSSDTYSSDTYSIDTYPSVSPSDFETNNTDIEKVEKHIKEKLNISELKQVHKTDNNLIGEILDNILDMYYSSQVKVQDEFKLMILVRRQISKLTQQHVIYIMDRLKGYTKKIKNKKSFIQATIYNASLEFNADNVNGGNVMMNYK